MPGIRLSSDKTVSEKPNERDKPELSGQSSFRAAIASGDYRLGSAAISELRQHAPPRYAVVIQLVVSGAVPNVPVLRSRCLANPDSLLKIEQSVGQPFAPTDALSDRFSLVLHDLRMSGVWKRTNRGRLKRSEQVICAHADQDRARGLTFLDIGASGGITTVEAVRTFREKFAGGVHAFLTDLNLWLLRYRRGPIVEYRAVNGEPIMARLGPLGIRLASQRRATALDGNPLTRFYLSREGLRRSMQLDARISLVHPIARNEPDITIMELDCLVYSEALRDRITAVRASNVLNFGYFDAPQICRALGYLHCYLQDGGCLVISKANGQQSDESENGTVWRKEGRRFRWLEDFGSGSEIRSVVDGWLHS